jgi:hypothetical protein
MAGSDSIPADELSAADFRSNPVWRFLTDAEGDGEADESFVAPSTEPLALGAFGSYLVAASYGLKNGASVPGCVQVDILGRTVHFTPALVYVEGKPVDPLASNAEQRIARITKTSNTRPLQWELAVPFHGELQTRRGRIARSAFVRALALLVRLVLLRVGRRLQ